MKKVFLVLFFFTSIFSVIAQEKPRIAVVYLQMTNRQAVNGSGRSYQDMQSTLDVVLGSITTDLVKTNKFRVIERSRIDQIIKEQGYQRNQLSDAQAVNIGKLLGVDKIITGEYGETHHPHAYTNWVSVNIRLIDVKTGEIEAAASHRDTNDFATYLGGDLVKRLFQ